jgi:hypothetical protein
MWWLRRKLETDIQKDKGLVECGRCQLKYQKAEGECPYCFGLEGHELKHLLSKRTKSRLAIGKAMIVLVIIIILLLLAVNGP